MGTVELSVTHGFAFDWRCYRNRTCGNVTTSVARFHSPPAQIQLIRALPEPLETQQNASLALAVQKNTHSAVRSSLTQSVARPVTALAACMRSWLSNTRFGLRHSTTRQRVAAMQWLLSKTWVQLLVCTKRV